MSIRIKTLNGYGLNDTEAVKVVPQTLTEEQQAQARTNIGAVKSWNELTDRPFGDSWYDGYIVPLTQLEGPDEMGSYNLGGLAHIPADGYTYTVNYNGTEYQCTAILVDVEGMYEAVVLGDATVLGVVNQDADKPFSIMFIGFADAMSITPKDSPDSVELSVYGPVVTTTKLPDKYCNSAVVMYYANSISANTGIIYKDMTFEQRVTAAEFMEAAKKHLIKIFFNGIAFFDIATAMKYPGEDYARAIAVTVNGSEVQGVTFYTAEYTPPETTTTE